MAVDKKSNGSKNDNRKAESKIQCIKIAHLRKVRTNKELPIIYMAPVQCKKGVAKQCQFHSSQKKGHGAKSQKQRNL